MLKLKKLVDTSQHLLYKLSVSKLGSLTTTRMQPIQQTTPEVQFKPFQSKEECNVGISTYLFPGRQLQGISKFLISDFVVNEVTPDKKVVQFKERPDISQADKLAQALQPKPNNNNQQQAEDENKYQINQAKRAQMIQKLGEQTTAAIQALYGRIEAKQKITEWSHSFKGPENRDERIQLHEFIKTNLPNLESRTDLGIIKLTYTKHANPKRFKKTKEYVYFKLYKTNIDTNNAIFKLSKVLGMPSKLFGMAGMKDKRGCTTQMISMYNNEPDVLAKFYRAASRNKQMWIGDIEEHKQEGVCIGGLYGNRFGLVIRFVEKREQVQKDLIQNLKNLETNGFINYFGMQRFGKGKVGTHHIGCEVLKKNWTNAVEELLLQETGDPKINELKRNIYFSGDFKKAQYQLPNKFHLEKSLFAGLQKYTQHITVFESLPRSLRMIYGHALQSYIWNKIVSKRIELHGNQVVPGDIVAKRAIAKVVVPAEEVEAQEDQVEQNVEAGDEELIVDEDYEIQVVTEATRSLYTPFDLVAPLFGAQTELPANCLLRPMVEEELKQLGLEESMFKTGLPKSLYLHGGYRKVLTRPEDMKWVLTNYTAKNEELQDGFYYLNQERSSTQGGLFALKLRVTLQKSSYATMLMRELLKLPSSFDIQEILNRRFKQK